MNARKGRKGGERNRNRFGSCHPIGDVCIMDVAVGDTLIMKKPHPCGNHSFCVLRVGMDFKIKCTACGHEIMLPRVKCEKNIKKIIKNGENN